ncbi:MAG TPA: GNAT family N-acetyltransferase [Gemmatimonadaceae bacterium]|jgi:RimJ/RimL family protein N-acetyltransferase
MRLHVEALYTCDAAGRLLTVNVAGGAPAPRFFFGSTPNGNAWWFRHDIDAALAEDLARLCESQPTSLDVVSAEPFVARLSRAAAVQKIWTGPAYHFPRDLPGADVNVVRVTANNATILSPHLEDWHGDVSPAVPMAVTLEDGKAVSVCASVRITPHAHEAGVDTNRDFRRRGYAARAVTAWARAVREMDRIPLYSTSWQNVASRALAAKLGLMQFGSDLHIT